MTEMIEGLLATVNINGWLHATTAKAENSKVKPTIKHSDY